MKKKSNKVWEKKWDSWCWKFPPLLKNDVLIHDDMRLSPVMGCLWEHSSHPIQFPKRVRYIEHQVTAAVQGEAAFRYGITRTKEWIVS